MNKNMKIANELIKIAKSLVANVLSDEEINNIKQYLNEFASKNGYTIKEDERFGYCLYGKTYMYCTETKMDDVDVIISFKFSKNKYTISAYSKNYGSLSQMISESDEIKNIENIKQNLESNIDYVLEEWQNNQIFGSDDDYDDYGYDE